MKVKINFDGNWLDEMDLPIQFFTLNEKIKRSLKSFFLFIGAAILSIFIPVLHFVLVPVFVLTAVVIAFLKFKERAFFDLTTLGCPVCKRNLNKGLKGLKKNESTLRLFCEECQKSITLVLPENKIG